MNQHTPSVAQDLPFSPDFLNRRSTAEQMTRMFSLQRDGFVVAVHAPWGDGKTYFGRNFAKMLEQEYNAMPVFIDAFEHDYVEDPFMVLASAVYAKIKEDAKLKVKAKDFLSKAVKVGKKLLPIAAELSLKTLTCGLVSDNFAEAISTGGVKITESLLEERLTGYAEQQKSVVDFRNALADFAKAHCARTTKRENFPKELPLIIFVDELDRCNPTFAVRMLERIKHFFEIENVVFVLLVNNRQIFQAIRGVYGSEIDAEHYFEKFVDHSFTLGGINPHIRVKPSLMYCEKYINISQYGNNAPSKMQYIEQAYEMTSSIIDWNNEISLRDIEKIWGYVSRQYHHAVFGFGGILAFLSTVKVKYPLEYIAFSEKDFDGMCKIVNQMLPGCPDDLYPRNILSAVIALYCDKEPTPEQIKVLRSIASSRPSDIIPSLMSQMDCKPC